MPSSTLALRTPHGILLLAAFCLTVPATPRGYETGHSQQAGEEYRVGEARTTADGGWVERTLRGMTLEEKLGQLLMVSYYGGFAHTESDEYRDLVEAVEKKRVGGFVVSTRGSPMGTQLSQVYPTAVLANQLQRRAKVPLLVAADYERGTAMRLAEGTSFPYAMAVAATGNSQDAYTMGRITAREARAVGTHWIFAPVADVNVNPENPIINTRSFGEDPERVAAFVAAYVRGVEENGALATAKHFPGHGDTSVDSHSDLPTIPADAERLERVELVPFRAAIRAGVSTIMTGHLAVPAFEPDKELPATLSPNILSELLRKHLGFDGIIVTDALGMGGVTNRYAPGEVAVRAMAAGADVLLVPPVPDGALLALKEAAESGRLPLARIEQSARRVLLAKAKLGLHRRREVDLEKLNEAFRRPEFVVAAQDIADRGVTLLRDEARLLPLDATRPLRVLLLAVAGDPDPAPGAELEREIRWRTDQLQVVRCDTRWTRADTVKLPPPESYDLAIAALLVRVADRKGSVGLPPEQAALVNQLLANGKPTIAVGFGSPYLVERFPQAKTWLGTFSTFDVNQRAAARALFGQVAIVGQLPVSVPGVAKRGEGLRVAANPMTLRLASQGMVARLQPAFALLDRAIADGLFAGAVLAIGHRGQLGVRAAGRASFQPQASSLKPDSAVEVGSLARPLVTGTAAALLVERGLLQLEAPVERYIPDWEQGPQPEWRKKVSIRHLLQGVSGLPSTIDIPYPADKQVLTSADIVRAAVNAPMESEPGVRAAPSFLEAVLLGETIARLTGERAAGGRPRVLLQVPGLKSCDILPIHSQSWGGEASKVIRAGITELRCSAPDLGAFAQMMLHGGIYGHQRILRRQTIELFTARQKAGNTERALGWDVAPRNGGLLSWRAYGYDDDLTGASLWADPEKELFVILLPAAVAEGQAGRVRALRDALHKAVVEALAPPVAPPDR